MNFLPVGGHGWPELGRKYFLHGISKGEQGRDWRENDVCLLLH